MSHTWTHLPQSGLSRSASFLLTDVNRLAAGNAGKRQLTRQALLNSCSAGQTEAVQREKSLTEVNEGVGLALET